METAQTNTAGEASSNDGSPPKKTRKRKQYPMPDHGVRFRIYPTDDQVRTLRAKVRARGTVRNWIVDVFERSHARYVGDEDTRAGLTIECTRDALFDEIMRLRADAAYTWLRCLSVWSCKHIVKQLFKARENAFKGQTRHPRRRTVRANGPGSWSTYYDGRNSDRHYRPERTKDAEGRVTGQCFHLSPTGPLRVRTGTGHLPDRIERFPTVTVRVDACGRWTASVGVVSNRAAERWAREQAGAPVPAPGEGTTTLARDDIAGLDFGMTQLVTTDTGMTWPAARVLREEERKRRIRSNECRGRARARSAGERLDGGKLRKTRRKAKRTWTQDAYAEGGAIALKRNATKAEKLRKHNERVRHARRARKAKLEALEERRRQEAEHGSETGDGDAKKDRGGRNPKVKCRKQGAAGNARCRRRRGRCDATAKRTRKLSRRLSLAQKGSARRERARLALAKHHAWIADHRQNAIHQLTWWLVSAFKALAWEDLSVKDLLAGQPHINSLSHQ